MNIYFSQFWRLWSSRSGCWQVHCPVRGLFLVCRQLPSCHSSHGRKRGKGSKLFCDSYEPLNPFLRASRSWPDYFLKAPPPDTIMLWILASTYELGSGKEGVQSIAASYKLIRLWFFHIRSWIWMRNHIVRTLLVTQLEINFYLLTPRPVFFLHHIACLWHQPRDYNGPCSDKS